MCRNLVNHRLGRTVACTEGTQHQEISSNNTQAKTMTWDLEIKNLLIKLRDDLDFSVDAAQNLLLSLLHVVSAL